MADEQLTLTITSAEDKSTSSGKDYVAVKDSEGLSGQYAWWVWDKDLAATVKAMVGQTIKVSVNRDGDFKTIKKFIGVADGAQPAAAAPTPSAAGHSSPAAAGGGGGQREAFKKDPVGVILDLRKTALNNASALVLKSLPEGQMTEGQLKATQDTINHMARRYFRELVNGFEGALGLPAAQDQEPVTAVNPDDDIPF